MFNRFNKFKDLEVMKHKILFLGGFRAVMPLDPLELVEPVTLV